MPSSHNPSVHTGKLSRRGFLIGVGDAHAGLITAQQNLTPEFPLGAFLLQ